MVIMSYPMCPMCTLAGQLNREERTKRQLDEKGDEHTRKGVEEGGGGGAMREFDIIPERSSRMRILIIFSFFPRKYPYSSSPFVQRRDYAEMM